MYYILLSRELGYDEDAGTFRTVQENIPETIPEFPDIPIEQRYSAEILKDTVKSEKEIPQNWWYLVDTEKFVEPLPLPVPPTLEDLQESQDQQDDALIELALLTACDEGQLQNCINTIITEGQMSIPEFTFNDTPIVLEQMGLAQRFASRIRAGAFDLEDVPTRWRAKVETIIGAEG